MIDEPKRPVSAQEQEVIRTAILRVPVESYATKLIAHVEELQVVAHCECGCGSVDFELPVDTKEQSKPIADGLANTPKGGGLGVIVWGTSSAITGLEVYDMGAGDEDKALPTASTIRPWEVKNVSE